MVGFVVLAMVESPEGPVRMLASKPFFCLARIRSWSMAACVFWFVIMSPVVSIFGIAGMSGVLGPV